MEKKICLSVSPFRSGRAFTVAAASVVPCCSLSDLHGSLHALWSLVLNGLSYMHLSLSVIYHSLLVPEFL